jgi:type II secretory pathway pseudopilin PulG
MAILMAMAVPLWSKVKQRDNEQELIFRGQEYMEAIGRYHAKFGAFPPDLETLSGSNDKKREMEITSSG